MDPYTIDFAALRALRAVYEYQSFSMAAERLHLGQSTISYTVDRLRRAFNDPLFIRQGAGIVPTDRCREIVRSARVMLDSFSDLIEPPAFDPMQAEASVTIATNYYERATILPPLIRELRQSAPGIHLNMIQSLADGEQLLRRGECDILLTPITVHEPTYYKRRLFSDQYVCVMDKDHPLANQTLTRDLYVSANHALVTYGENWRSFYLVEVEECGFELSRTVSIPSPEDIAGLLEGTDMISTIPSRIANKLGEDIVCMPCPFPGPFDLDMYWTARTHNSTMLSWLRQQIAKTAALL